MRHRLEFSDSPCNGSRVPANLATGRARNGRPATATFQGVVTMTKRVSLILSAATLCLGLALAPAIAQDAMKKDTMSKDTMSKDSMSKDSMSKDHMSKDTMKKDATAKDTMGKDSMAKDNMSKGTMSK
jgi:pentapeptide MXKDX repeat protein